MLVLAFSTFLLSESGARELEKLVREVPLRVRHTVPLVDLVQLVAGGALLAGGGGGGAEFREGGGVEDERAGTSANFRALFLWEAVERTVL